MIRGVGCPTQAGDVWEQNHVAHENEKNQDQVKDFFFSPGLFPHDLLASQVKNNDHKERDRHARKRHERAQVHGNQGQADEVEPRQDQDGNMMVEIEFEFVFQ